MYKHLKNVISCIISHGHKFQKPVVGWLSSVAEKFWNINSNWDSSLKRHFKPFLELLAI